MPRFDVVRTGGGLRVQRELYRVHIQRLRAAVAAQSNRTGVVVQEKWPGNSLLETTVAPIENYRATSTTHPPLKPIAPTVGRINGPALGKREA